MKGGKDNNEPEAYEKLKELSPGDIIRELWQGEEVARYLVISRTIRWPEKNYSYQEYSCIIIFYSASFNWIDHEPGTKWVIDTHDLRADLEGGIVWEVVVESGLSWEDIDAYEKVGLNPDEEDI
jgi:hypothetical protein